MTTQTNLSGSFTFANTTLTLNRMGYGAMQLAGHQVGAAAQSRRSSQGFARGDCGVNHIDTSDFYGPHVTNQIIKQALHPYKNGLVIVTKVGASSGGRQVPDARALASGTYRRSA